MKSISDRLSIVASALSADLRAAPRLARQLQFHGLLVDAWSAGLSLPELSATGRRELLRVISSENQQVVGLRADLAARGLAPGADADQIIDRLDRAMEAAVGLQAPLICVDLGPLPRPANAAKPKPAIAPHEAGLIIIPSMNEPAPAAEPSAPPPDPAFVAQVTSAMTEIGTRADRYGVTVAFSSSLASFASLDEALRRTRCPWFGVDLDPVAILRDEWDRDAIFSALGPLVRHVRARDASVGEDKRTKPTVISRGDTKWSELLAALDGSGYHGWLTLDPMELSDRSAAAVAGAKYLRLVSE
jgi:sugar phosphate isomerase/epimerase